MKTDQLENPFSFTRYTS